MAGDLLKGTIMMDQWIKKAAELRAYMKVRLLFGPALYNNFESDLFHHDIQNTSYDLIILKGVTDTRDPLRYDTQDKKERKNETNIQTIDISARQGFYSENNENLYIHLYII